MTLEDQLAQGRFLSYERHAVSRLRDALPATERRDDLEAIVRSMALDACSRFDPGRGAKFTTFLFGHLRTKRLEFVRNYYRECRDPSREVALFEDDLFAPSGPEVQAEVGGLLEGVSGATRSVLQLALTHNSTELRRAFGLRTWKHTTSHLLGVSARDLGRAVHELRQEIPKHLSSIQL